MMERDEIVRRLKEYQHSEENTPLLREIAAGFMAAIHRRIVLRHRKCAECAVRKVLEKTFATPAYSKLCLDAMLQLCRDDERWFTEYQDENLISRINMNRYFSPIAIAPSDIVVETQEGVV